MSYEAWGEPDDPPELPEGCMSEDEVDELRALIKHVNIDPKPGSMHDAALVMIDYKLRTGDVDENDPHLVWAKHMMRDVV